jgi:hypothetical protein
MVARSKAQEERARRRFAFGEELVVGPASAPRRIGVAFDQRGAVGRVADRGAKELPTVVSEDSAVSAAGGR